MKNLLKLVAVFMLMFSFISKAQSAKVGTPNEDSNNIRFKLATNAAKMTENMAPFYHAGYSYSQFKTVALGTSGNAATAEGEALLVIVYNFLKDGVSSAQIIKSYNGKEMGDAMVKSKGNDVSLFATPENEPKLGGGEVIIQSKGGCRWYQISCWIDDIFGAGTAVLLVKGILAIIFH